MSDFYTQIAEQNDEVIALLEKEAAKNNVVLSVKALNFLTSALISCTVGGKFLSALGKQNISPIQIVGEKFRVFRI